MASNGGSEAELVFVDYFLLALFYGVPLGIVIAWAVGLLL